jgi:hypothetical protein
LVFRRLQWGMLQGRNFTWSDSDNERYLVVLEVMEIRSVSEKETQQFEMDRLILKKLNLWKWETRPRSRSQRGLQIGKTYVIEGT